MKKCRLCNIEKSINSFDLQSKLSENRDTRCKECVKESKKEFRNSRSFIKDKFVYETNNKKYGYSLKICEIHGSLTYENIRLRIRVVKNKIQTNLSCISCLKEKAKLQRGDHVLDLRKNLSSLKCSACKKNKEKSCFSVSALKDKYGKCKECSSISSKKSFILSKYKLSEHDYNALIKEQNNLCKICGNKETGQFKGKKKRLSVDHNHGTGKVRGLLCSYCNIGLGVFKDSPNILRKAIKYLDDND